MIDLIEVQQVRIFDRHHQQEIEFPEYAEVLDLEFEFAIVIGKSGIDIKVENARDYIYG